MRTGRSPEKRNLAMKKRALVVLASLFVMLIAGAVLESRAPLVAARAALAGPRCEACR